jgi:hypothetical protein
MGPPCLQKGNEELSALKPVKVGAGLRYGLACSVSDLRVLKDFTA